MSTDRMSRSHRSRDDVSDEHASGGRVSCAERRTLARALLPGVVTGLTRTVAGWLLDLIRS
ncbi:hypothetical protein ACF07Y_01320 [Streptomyces sp. NPDC016566]|uniref:hypothetical protein n=1 Tax=Streptomyces sp. NPDC016566 TaxID=3364967 RepID=UPI0036FC8890